MEIIQDTNYQILLAKINDLLQESKVQLERNVNAILVKTYYEVGRYIVEFEQNGKERAEYGSHLINRLANDLTMQFGKGFGKANLIYMRKLYLFVEKRWDTVPPFKLESLL